MRNGAGSLGLSLSEFQLNHFIAYLYELKRWNRVHKLTSIEDPRKIIFGHFLDSLTPVKILTDWNGLKVLDIGSGAGLPGIPLKIAFPDMELSLLEARQKKAAFLHSLLGVLGLEGVNIYNQRLEEFRMDSRRNTSFDRILSRGVGMIEAVKDHWEELIRNQGVMIFYGGNEKLFRDDKSFSVEQVSVSIPLSDRARTLFMIRKSGRSLSASEY